MKRKYFLFLSLIFLSVLAFFRLVTGSVTIALGPESNNRGKIVALSDALKKYPYKNTYRIRRYLKPPDFLSRWNNLNFEQMTYTRSSQILIDNGFRWPTRTADHVSPEAIHGVARDGGVFGIDFDKYGVRRHSMFETMLN